MNNGWLKLGVLSLGGFIVSILVLGGISSFNTNSMNYHNSMFNNGQMPIPMNNNGMYMSNMSGQNMNSMNGMPNMIPAMNSSYDMNLQIQLNQMQMQLNQIHQQMQNMNSNNGSMGGSNSGGMGMMPMM